MGGFGHVDGASFSSTSGSDKVMSIVLFPSFSGLGYVVGGWVLVVVCWREVHNDSTFYGGFGIGDFFFTFFICVDVGIFCALPWVVCGLHVNGDAQSVAYNTAAVRRRFDAFTGGMFTWIVSLQGVFLWRLKLHLLLYTGRCSCSLFVGLLLVGRSSSVMRPFVSGDIGVCSGRSTIQQHDVLLMGLKFEDSSSNRELTRSFILNLLHFGRWRRTKLWQRWSATAMGTRYSFNGFVCNFIFFQGYPVRGLVVRVLYQ